MGNNPSSAVEAFVVEYNKKEYQEALTLLETDWTEQSQLFQDEHDALNEEEDEDDKENDATYETEDWAKDIYTTLRHEPSNERCKALNAARKTCLNLLYDMVRTWDKEYHYSDKYAQAMKETFGLHRLNRVLGFCLPMDRAQALYKMRWQNMKAIGMPWFSKLHLAPNTAYASEFPDEQREWNDIYQNYQQRDPMFLPPMSGKMFRLLFCDTLQLRSHTELAKWSRPFQLPESERREMQKKSSSPSKRRASAESQATRGTWNGTELATSSMAAETRNVSSLTSSGGRVSNDAVTVSRRSRKGTSSSDVPPSIVNMQWTDPNISLPTNPLASINSTDSYDTTEDGRPTFSHMELSVQQAMQQLAQSRLMYRSSRILQGLEQKPPETQAAVVFTDVQGSTRLWEADPDAMNDALKLHDQIMRTCLTQCRGYEVKTEGDAFHVSFYTAVDAVQFCLQAQQQLYKAHWQPEILNLPDACDDQDDGFCGLRVRMAIHYGPVTSQCNEVTGRTEYTGEAVAIAKALEEMAHGGQILVSGNVWNAASYQADTTLGSPQVIDLGKHVLSMPKTKKKNKKQPPQEANGENGHDHHHKDYIAKTVLQLVPQNLAYDFTTTQTSTRKKPMMVTSSTRSVELNETTGRQFPPAITKKQLTPSFHDAPGLNSGNGQVTMLFVYTTAIKAKYDENGQMATLLPGLAKTIQTLVGTGPGYQCKDLMVAFETEMQAVEFGLQLQETVAREPIVVGGSSRNGANANDNDEMTSFDVGGLLMVGLHSGEFTKLEPNQTNGRADYFGRVVNRAARVASVTEPGCVYLGAFEGVKVELGGADADDAALASEFVGTKELKGLNEEMCLYSCSRKTTMTS